MVVQALSACSRLIGGVAWLIAAGGFGLLAFAGADRAAAPEAPAEAAPAAASASALGPPVSAKILRYAERLLHQYDSNGDGVLQKEEWLKIRGSPQLIDANRDGQITLDELGRHTYRYGQSHRIHLFQPTAEVTPPPSLFRPASRTADTGAEGDRPEPQPVDIANVPEMPTPAAAESASDRVVRRSPRLNRKFYVSRSSVPNGLPEWFNARDADGDGQLTLAEFAPSPSRADMAEFSRYDTNRDGVITAKELLGPSKTAKANSATRGSQP